MPTNPTDTSYTALPREALRAGNLTLHKLERVMDGDLDEIIDALSVHDQAERLAEMT